MVLVFVRLHRSKTAASHKSLYLLALPDESGSWSEVEVRPSPVAGFGVYPRNSYVWNSPYPVVLPFLGLETCVKDQHTLTQLLSVLRGQFQQLTVGDLEIHQCRNFRADGLFAVPQTRAVQPRLPPDTQLLQTASASDGSVCYLLADAVRTVLHLQGHHAHLFELLCAHEKHEHIDRHLATVRRLLKHNVLIIIDTLLFAVRLVALRATQVRRGIRHRQRAPGLCESRLSPGHDQRAHSEREREHGDGRWVRRHACG